MPASITASAYDPDTHTVDVEVAGGPSGVLVIYRDVTGGNARTVAVVAQDDDYTGGTVAVTDRFPDHGVCRYYAYVDDVQQDYVDVTVDFDVPWLLSLSDPAKSRQVCIVYDRRDSWRSRKRRGWYGDVIGSGRTVGVTDVSMGGRSGNVRLLVTAADHNNLDQLLREGILCLRGIPPRSIGYILLEDYTDLPAGGGDNAHWLYDVRFVHTWPTGVKERLPDDPEE